MAKNKFYAIRVGRKQGVFTSWDECKSLVEGFPGAIYKGFTTEQEAINFAYEIKSSTPKTNISKSNKSTNKPILEGPYAFVDGSFNSETNVYGYGGFLCVNSNKIPIIGCNNDENMVSMRNVAGEISGAIAAVKKAEEMGLKTLTILYDYKGIECWAKDEGAVGAWKANKPETKAYSDFMKSNDRKVTITFKHVKGHTGIEGNEIADIMAKKAVGISITNSQNDVISKIIEDYADNQSNMDNTLHIDTNRKTSIDTYDEKEDDNTAFAVKSEDGTYFIGYNKWDSQLRKAVLYNSLKYAQQTRDDHRFIDKNAKIVKVKIFEVAE